MKDSAMLAGICWVFQGFLALLILPAEKRLIANSIPLSLSLYFFFFFFQNKKALWGEGL